MKFADILQYDDNALNEGIENYAIGEVNSMGMTTKIYKVDRDISFRRAFNMLSVEAFRGLIYPDNKVFIWNADEAIHDICDRYIRTKLIPEYNSGSVISEKFIIELKKDENNQPVLGVYHYPSDIGSEVLFARLRPALKTMRECSLVLFYNIDTHKFLKAFNLS
jgi:hypothetical protein